MNLKTTLIMANNGHVIKTNHRSQFLHFSHPLKVLKKIDSENLDKIMINKDINHGYDGQLKQNHILNNNLNRSDRIKNIKKISDQKQYNLTNRSNALSINQEQNRQIKTCREQNNKQNEQRIMNRSHDVYDKYFNQDQGILQHFYQVYMSEESNNRDLSNKSMTTQNSILNNDKRLLSLMNNGLNKSFNESKCFVMFGLSLNIMQLQEFHQNHEDIQIRLKVFKYNEHEYLKQIKLGQIKNNKKTQRLSYRYSDKSQLNIRELQINNMVEELDGNDVLDCQEVSFVVEISYKNSQNQAYKQENIKLDKFKMNFNNKQSNKQKKQSNKQKKKQVNYLYFFPNINSLKSESQKRQIRTNLNLNISELSSKDIDKRVKLQTAAITPSQIRKSHQNFRILQVLQYYLKLQCHSDHIMITNNESKIIKNFIDLIYNEQIRNFQIFIDHQRKYNNKTFRSTIKSLQNNKNYINNNNCNISIKQQNICTTELLSQQQFISIDGFLILNDQFLSKLAQIKTPQEWLDNQDFRQQKRQMYKMKIQQHQILKELRDSKNKFTQNINYLVSLVGLPKLSYQEITIDSLKLIKNAKIKQITTQLKQLINISQNLDIRLQKLKKRKTQFQKLKQLKNQAQTQDLKILRYDITNIQKQINLNKNQLNALVHSQSSNENQGILGQKSQNEHKNSSFIQSSFGGRIFTNQTDKSNTNSAFQNNKNGLNKKNSKISKNLGQQILPSAKNNASENRNASSLSRSICLNASSILGLSSMGGKAEQLLPYRKSSVIFAKYGAALQLLRKKKFQQSLLKQMTKCQFEAQKQYQRLKADFIKASNELRNIMNDCD